MAPNLRAQQRVPRGVPRRAFSRISRDLASRAKEISRALPSSKGGETPKQLQTYRTEVYSYFTVPSTGSMLLYSAENWVRIKLELETAGPVAVGTSAEIGPVLSGHGRLLNTNEEYEVTLSKGARFYVVSETVNRISVTIEPIPWLEQIDTDMVAVNDGIIDAINAMATQIVNAISGLQGAATPTSSTGNDMDSLPPCPPSRGMIPRLTPLTRPPKMRP